jgi:hypothetical protein
MKKKQNNAMVANKKFNGISSKSKGENFYQFIISKFNIVT